MTPIQSLSSNRSSEAAVRGRFVIKPPFHLMRRNTCRVKMNVSVVETHSFDTGTDSLRQFCLVDGGFGGRSVSSEDERALGKSVNFWLWHLQTGGSDFSSANLREFRTANGRFQAFQGLSFGVPFGVERVVPLRIHKSRRPTTPTRLPETDRAARGPIAR